LDPEELMSTAILIAAILAVKWIDYRQTLWILTEGKYFGFRELNPLISKRSRIAPVMGTITAVAIVLGLVFGDALLGVYLAVSAAIVYRNRRIGVQLAKV